MTADDTAAGPCDDETVVVPPPTEAAPELAWSHEDAATEVLSGRPWRSVWVIAGVGVACAVVIALIVVGVGIAGRRTKTLPTPTQAAATPATQTKPPADDDEYVAVAISPTAINRGSPHVGADGTSSDQKDANKYALSACRANSGNDDCLLVGSMRKGCVSYAVDRLRRQWSSGIGPDADSATADALRRMRDRSAETFTAVKCSAHPGNSSAPASASAA